MIKRLTQALTLATTHPGPDLAHGPSHAATVQTLASGQHALWPLSWPIAGPQHVRQPLFEALILRGGQPTSLTRRLGAAMVQGAVDASVAGAVLGLCLYVRLHYGKGAASDFLWQHHLLLVSAATFLAWPAIWTYQALHHRR